MARPDFSDYVVHFTKDGGPYGLSYHQHKNDHRLLEIAKMNARDRLLSILQDKHIEAHPTPWLGARAVCFTECTWASLIYHARRYSFYGIGFSKEFLFGKGGGPAFYIKPDLFEEQKEYVCKRCSGLAYCDNFASFITPFVPLYADGSYVEKYWQGRDLVDFTHEREWRLAKSLENFSYDDVSFVIIASNEDLGYFSDVVDHIEIDKFLIMKNYEQVESFWPLHVRPDD